MFCVGVGCCLVGGLVVAGWGVVWLGISFSLVDFGLCLWVGWCVVNYVWLLVL